MKMLGKGKAISFLWLALSGSARAAAWDFVVIGDGGKVTPFAQTLFEDIRKTPYRRVVMPGDLLYSPHKNYDEVWSSWKNAGFLFEVMALGNHDHHPREALKYFDLPKSYYSKTYGSDVRFIVLNSDDINLVKAQARWLEDVLKKARERFIFAVFHHPPVTVTRFHARSEKERFHKTTGTIFRKYRSKITALITGHDHVSELVQVGDLPMILSGAGWETRPDDMKDFDQAGIRVKTEWQNDQDPVWVHLSLEAEQDQMLARFIRASDHQTLCTVRLVSGEVADLQQDCRR